MKHVPGGTERWIEKLKMNNVCAGEKRSLYKSSRDVKWPGDIPCLDKIVWQLQNLSRVDGAQAIPVADGFSNSPEGDLDRKELNVKINSLVRSK